METKTITLRQDQHRFAKDLGINVSGFTRKELTKVIDEDSSINVPTGDTRRHDHKRTRTQITVRRKELNLVEERNINLAQFVQDRLQNRMDGRRNLQEAEKGHTPVVSDSEHERMKKIRVALREDNWRNLSQSTRDWLVE